MLRVLLQNGASPARKTETGADTPLHLAATRGHADITRELLRGGADYRAKARNGWTPLHAAMFNNHTEVARLLIRAGADPIETTVRGSTVRTLSTGGAAEKWTRAPRVDDSSLSSYSDGSSIASPGARARSPARELVNDVVAARRAALWELRERRSQERERERIDGAEAALQQHMTHQQRRDEKRRQLELSLSVRVSPDTLLAACRHHRALSVASILTDVKGAVLLRRGAPPGGYSLLAPAHGLLRRRPRPHSSSSRFHRQWHHRFRTKAQWRRRQHRLGSHRLVRRHPW